MVLNLRDCLETFERIADVNSFIFSYVAPETQVYFLRIELATMGQNSYVKYNIKYMSSSPAASV